MFENFFDAYQWAKVARVKQALRPFGRVVLLVPSADLVSSIDSLRERSVTQRGMSWVFDDDDFFERWVTSSCNAGPATHIVYTDGQTPAQTCDAVLASTGLR